jgi:hypothetical protein
MTMDRKWTFGYGEADSAAELILALTDNGKRNEFSCHSFEGGDGSDYSSHIVGLVLLLTGGYLEGSPMAHGSDHSYLIATPEVLDEGRE